MEFTTLQWLSLVHLRQKHKDFNIKDVPDDVISAWRCCRLISRGTLTAEAVNLLSTKKHSAKPFKNK